MKLSKEYIITLLKDTNDASLLKRADNVRKQYVGDDIHLRGLIEFSNICRKNCLYCGINRDNKNALRYRMSEENIVKTAKTASDIGLKTVVLQSGEDVYFDTSKMCHIIEPIKKFNLAVTLSIGERDFNDYKAFRNAGADRYLIRIETTDKKLYETLSPCSNWQKRYECILNIKELGYELGSGIMVGLPNQSIESIANDLLFLQDLEVDMAGIGPFIPHPDTKLAQQKGGSFDLALRTMAVMRLLLEDINIPATTAMEVLNENGRLIALQSGANVVMPNITDISFRKLYELYPNKEKAMQKMDSLILSLQSINRNISTDYGFHKK